MKFRQFRSIPWHDLAGHLQRGVRYLHQSLRELGARRATGASGGDQVTLACDIGRFKILFLELEKKKDGVTIVRFEKIDRANERHQDAENIKKFFARYGKKPQKVRISVKGQGVIARFIRLPRMRPEEVKSALAFEAEKYIPFKYEEVILDYQILDGEDPEKDRPQMDLLLVAVKKEEVYPLIGLFQDAGVDIELVDIDALAAINALEYFHPESFQTSAGILDLGTEISSLSIVRAARPRFIRDIAYGAVDILKRLQRKLGISEQKARELFFEVGDKLAPEAAQIIHEGLDKLVTDLKVSLDYYLDQNPTAEPIQTLYVAGGEASRPIFLETLTKGLHIPVQAMDVLSKVQVGPEVDAGLLQPNLGFLPVAMGLCLRDV